MTEQELDAYYALEDPKKRREFLEGFGQDETAALCLSWLEHRRYTIDKSGTTDVFMRGWMTLQTDAHSQTTIFNRGHRKKTREAAMHDLGIDGYASLDERGKEILRREWADFCDLLLEVSQESQAYCSTLFSIVRLKKESVIRKLCDDILLVVRRYPEDNECTEIFQPFAETFIEHTKKVLKGSEQYFD